MDQLDPKDRLADADQRLTRLLADAARAWWGLGEICNEVKRDRLFLAGGYKDVFSWALARHKLKRTTVDKAMAVATHFSEAMAEREGTEKLASTVRYLETTRKIEKAGSAPALTFRVQREGKFQSIPWEKADYRDIDEATALVERARRKTAEPVAPVDPAALARVKRFAAVLQPASRDVVRGDRVSVARGSDGKHRYDFRGVAEEDLEALGQALIAAARKQACIAPGLAAQAARSTRSGTTAWFLALPRPRGGMEWRAVRRRSYSAAPTIDDQTTSPPSAHPGKSCSFAKNTFA